MNSRIISPDNDFSAKAPFSIQEGRCREALARFFLSLPPAGQQSDAQRAAYRAALRLAPPAGKPAGAEQATEEAAAEESAE